MESNKVSKSDEIDLSQLFQSIGNGFKSFGQAILLGLASLRRLFIDNIIFFAILFIIGLAFGLFYSSFFKRVHYTSSMIISCSYLNSRIVENAMEKLNLLCKESDRSGLSDVLGIPVHIALNIRQFGAKNFVSEQDRIELEVLKEQLNNVAADKKDLVNKIIGKIEIGNVQAFQINVSVFDPDVVQTLDSSLVKYFRNNGYVKKRIETNRRSLLSRKVKLIKESNKLDSLKNVLFANFQSMAKQNREGSNNVILSDKYLTDPIAVLKEDLDLNNELLRIDDNLDIRPDFEVIDGLTTFREPSNLSLSSLLLLSVLISIVAGYILLGFWKFNKYLSTIG